MVSVGQPVINDKDPVFEVYNCKIMNRLIIIVIHISQQNNINDCLNSCISKATDVCIIDIRFGYLRECE